MRGVALATRVCEAARLARAAKAGEVSDIADLDAGIDCEGAGVRTVEMRAAAPNHTCVGCRRRSRQTSQIVTARKVRAPIAAL